MTTCHDYPRRSHADGHLIYPSMGRLNPDFALHAGDVEYYDKAKPFAWTVDLMRFHWNRLFALPFNRSFYSQTTTYFLKDDHDTLKNDCWPGQTYGSVSFDEGVEVFREQFPAVDRPYGTVRWGRHLQIWMIEGREYRSPNNSADGPDKTILGAAQKRWLFESVRGSDATFRILFSPTPIIGPDRDNKRDNHSNKAFRHEGDELRRFLAGQRNMFVLCGDRHWQYASRILDTDTGPHAMWEFGCGPGSDEHQLGWKKGDRRESHEFLRVAGGFLSGHVQPGDRTATLTLRHHSVDGETVNEIVFRADTPGQ